jgi:hypothetical protein
MIMNIEDCLEYLAGLHKAPASFTIEKTDHNIMTSIARQTFRGTALTDRQLTLMKEKLQPYRDQFTNLDWDFDYAVEQLRQPLRHIDRSKYVKIVDYPDDIPYNADEADKFIAIRFPFKKSDISLISECLSDAGDGYYHSKGTHIHYFAFNELNLLNLGDRFFNKDFIIDDLIKTRYLEIKNIQANVNEYMPFFQDGKFYNTNAKLINIIEQETNNDPIKIYDRRFRYCLENISLDLDATDLEKKIITRENIYYQSKPSTEMLDSILYSLYNLDRFPLLVILDKDNVETQLYEVANFFRDLIPSEKQSVLFREEEKDNGFNQLVKDRKLNNWVDNSTKIVYINSNTVPKVLFESGWSPICAFAYNSNNNKNVQAYIKNNCDLIVHREETISPFLRMYNR